MVVQNCRNLTGLRIDRSARSFPEDCFALFSAGFSFQSPSHIIFPLLKLSHHPSKSLLRNRTKMRCTMHIYGHGQGLRSAIGCTLTLSPSVPSTSSQLRNAVVSRVLVAIPAVLWVFWKGRSRSARKSVVLPASPSPTTRSRARRQGHDVFRRTSCDHTCGACRLEGYRHAALCTCICIHDRVRVEWQGMLRCTHVCVNRC